MIEVSHLTKVYGRHAAVHDLSFKFPNGNIYGFLGPNGAGKSTTMNILTGCLAPTSGTVKINGFDITLHPEQAKRCIGYLPEIPPLWGEMTPFEYLMFVAEAKGISYQRALRQVETAMEDTGIGDQRDRLISNLSKGTRQRVGIAQALLGNPDILILDEPTVGLDPKQIIEIRNLIRGLGKGHTVILSTHILQEVQAVCDRIVIINKGKIVANEKTENIAHVVANNRRFNVKIVGPQREVLALLKGMPGIAYAETLAERDGDAYTYLVESEAGVDIRKKLFFALSERGWAMIGLEALGMSLEDIFITVVDQSESLRTAKSNAPTRVLRRTRGKERSALEMNLGATLVEEAQKQRARDAENPLSDEDDN